MGKKKGKKRKKGSHSVGRGPRTEAIKTNARDRTADKEKIEKERRGKQ
jgi:hypothetical protein